MRAAERLREAAEAMGRRGSMPWRPDRRVALLLLLAAASSSPGRPVAPAARDDYYRHVNARWLATTPIPADSPWISPFVRNYRLIQQRLGTIVAAAAATSRDADERRVAGLYLSFLRAQAHTSARHGLAALGDEEAAIRAMRSAADLARVIARFNRSHFYVVDDDYRGATPLGLQVGTDPDDARRQVVPLRPAGIGLGSASAYTDPSPAAQSARDAYREHIRRSFALAADADAPTAAVDALRIETALAQARIAEGDALPLRTSVAELTRAAPGLDWVAFSRASGLRPDTVLMVSAPGYTRRLAAMTEREPASAWRAYFRWQLLRRYAPYLGRRFAEEDFAFEGRQQLGARTMQTAAERGVLLVRSAFPMQLARLYVARYGDPAARAEVAAMTRALIAAYRRSIAATDRFAPSTRVEALRKLDRLVVKVGWPERWPEKPVAVRPDDVIGNLMAVARHDYAAGLRDLDRPTDRSRWFLDPTSVSAYYDPATNQIAIPAGRMLWPWYRREAGLAWNYGGIGVTIGHEIGHGFDDQGSRYDATGRRRDWWTPRDRARFDRLIDRLVAQYDALPVDGRRRIDGRLTRNENLADLSGLILAWRALHRVDGRRGAAARARDARFFRAFATQWRARYSDALLDRILVSDGHAPQSARANGPLRNFAPFRSHYGVRPGDGMYVAPEMRVALW